MEVVSPLTFGWPDAAAGSTKRRFACSPIHHDANSEMDSIMGDDSTMEDSCAYPADKRRRKGNEAEGGVANNSLFGMGGRSPGGAHGES